MAVNFYLILVRPWRLPLGEDFLKLCYQPCNIREVQKQQKYRTFFIFIRSNKYKQRDLWRKNPQVLVVPDKVTKENQLISDSENETDSYLIQQCLRGHTQSYSKLYRRYQQTVRSILYQLCTPTNLDDVVQEVFLQAWKGLPKFRQTAKFSTWLYRIAWNQACDQRQADLKRRNQWQTLAEKAPTQQEALDLMNLHYQDLVQRGLENLSFDHRTILVLHDLQEVPQKEIAQILDIPLGTVKSRLFHARAAMRQFLQNQGVQP